MPTTWIKADTTWSAAAYTWGDFSVATELLYMVEDGRSGRYKTDQIYADFFKDRAKKKRVIELIMKVKSNKIQQKVEIPVNAKISLSDIDMVIQEVLFKPKVKIYVD